MKLNRASRDEAATLIKRANKLIVDEFKQLADAHVAARIVAWDDEPTKLARLRAVRIASAKVRTRAGESLIQAALDAVESSEAAFNAAELKVINGLQSHAVFTAVWHAAMALRVKDLISEEDFELLYGPWREVIERSETTS